MARIARILTIPNIHTSSPPEEGPEKYRNTKTCTPQISSDYSIMELYCTTVHSIVFHAVFNSALQRTEPGIAEGF